MAVTPDPYDRDPTIDRGTTPLVDTPVVDRDTTAYDRTATPAARRGFSWGWAVAALVVILGLFALFGGLGNRDVNTTASTNSRPAVTHSAPAPAAPANTAPAAPANTAAPK